jgi:hypothetical protein
VLPTVPLTRLLIAGDPPLTALVLPRELSRIKLQAGASVEVQLPLNSLKTFIQTRTPTTNGTSRV